METAQRHEDGRCVDSRGQLGQIDAHLVPLRRVFEETKVRSDVFQFSSLDISKAAD